MVKRILAGVVWLLAIALVISACTGGGSEETKASVEPVVKTEEVQPVAEAEPVVDLGAEETAFDEALGSQVTEFGNGLSLIGELFMLLSTDPLAAQSEEFEYTSGEVVKMLDRMLANANTLDAPETRQEAKGDYIAIIEKTQQAVDVAFEGVSTLDAEQITEGGTMMDEVNKMIESFMTKHY